ncbi:unnamed protein product, partial [Closterium sp. Yama58-4]
SNTIPAVFPPPPQLPITSPPPPVHHHIADTHVAHRILSTMPSRDHLTRTISALFPPPLFLPHQITVHHHIADTHVAHHIFSTMPHYHAEEATRAIKPILKDYYQFDGTPIVKALWREVSQCVCVAPDADGPKGVYWYSNKVK